MAETLNTDTTEDVNVKIPPSQSKETLKRKVNDMTSDGDQELEEWLSKTGEGFIGAPVRKKGCNGTVTSFV